MAHDDQHAAQVDTSIHVPITDQELRARDEAMTDSGQEAAHGANKEDEENEADEEEDEMLKFTNVITAIDFAQLKNHAVDVRLQQDLSTKLTRSNLTCEVVEPPLSGSFNLVYVLEFNDGVKWVARFPIQGTRMKEADIDRMNTDYSTLKYIRKKCNIPAPEVYAWETTCSTVGVPFALMSFVTGVSVYDRWSDKDWITEDRRMKILTSIAHAMAKLQILGYDKMGTLRFSDEDTVSHIGPYHTFMEDDETYETEGTVYIELCGPHNTLTEHFGEGDSFEDLRPASAAWHRGLLELLRLAAQSIPPYFQADRCEIEFLDYAPQNILIDDDCNVTAILDWDGVRTATQGAGCTRYPSWITRDWDPGHYHVPEDGDWEASGEDRPEQLLSYRKHYAEVFASLGLAEYDPRQTRLSHICEAIRLAMDDRFARQYIADVLLNHAYGTDTWPWELGKICHTLKNPSSRAAKVMSKKLLARFRSMWHAEWETAGGDELVYIRSFLPDYQISSTHNNADKLMVKKRGRRIQGYGRSISQYLNSKRAQILGIIKK